MYEYTLHNDPGDTLQVFTTHTMDSTYFSAKQTLDLLNFLSENHEKIEALASQLQTQRQERKTTQERINNLFSGGRSNHDI